MGTLQTIVTRALVRVRGQSQLIHAQEDTQVLGLVNGILADINRDLQNIESNMVYAVGTITTVADTPEYTPAFTFDSIMDDGVWIDDNTTFLTQMSEADKVTYDYQNQTGEPVGYYVTEDGKIGFLWVPDDAYTVSVMYFTPLTEMTAVATDTLPFAGLWNRYVEERMVMELKMIRDRDVSQESVLVGEAYRLAMAASYRRGTRMRMFGGDFFNTGDF